MKLAILALSLGMSLSASADVIKCSFTEPFIHLTYNTATEKLVENNPIMESKRTLTGVTFQIKYAGTFLLKDKSGKLLAELKLNNKGSDGMSEAIFPYEAKYIGALGDRDRTLFGGCTSTLKPMVKLPN